MAYTGHGILQVKILKWVAFPFSRGSSQPRDRIQVFRIAGRFFNQLNHKGSPDFPLLQLNSLEENEILEHGLDFENFIHTNSLGHVEPKDLRGI